MKNVINAMCVASALLVGAACNHDNENYCEGAPQNDCRALVDGRVDGPVTGCKAAPDKCTGDKPVCDMTTDTCVPCLGNNVEDMSCPAAAPVCSSQACGVCTEDAQCTSKTCLADGTCAVASAVLYASPSGSGSACTPASKCGIADAVAAVSDTRNVIHLDAGSYVYTTPTTLSFPKSATIVGRGATIDRQSGGNNATLTVPIGSSNLTVDFATVTGGDGAQGHGISCLGTGAILVRKAEIGNNGGAGISGGGCTVTVTGATVTTNTGGGITATGGTVTVTGATVTTNSGGGISLTNSGFKLVNNFIVHNGNSVSAAAGGVSITTPTSPKIFEFNTVADNDAIATASGGIGGVKCLGTDIKLVNSILSNNRAGNNNAAATAQTDAICVLSSTASLASAATVKFKNDQTAPFDYHISNGSVAIDAAATASTVDKDFDGDARPQGAGKDQGADEFKP